VQFLQSPDFPPPSYDELGAHPSGTSFGSEGLTMIVAPPDIFSGDESVTPTPGMDNDSDSQVSTPRIADSHFADAMALATEGKVCTNHDHLYYVHKIISSCVF